MLQVHYHRSGKAEADRTAIGLYFAEGVVDKQVLGRAVTPPRPGLFSRPEMTIPAGAPDHEVTGELTLDDDHHLTAIVPHMHWLGKDFTLTAERPDGTERPLIRVDRWDFDWQDTYEFSEPFALPKGTRIRMVAHFDNSEDNPANPTRPPVEVRWGERTTNEMCIGFLQLTRDSEALGGRPPAGRPRSGLGRSR